MDKLKTCLYMGILVYLYVYIDINRYICIYIYIDINPNVCNLYRKYDVKN